MAHVKKVLDFYSGDNKPNYCQHCKVDMGLDNPRQLCGKTYCKQIPMVCVLFKSFIDTNICLSYFLVYLIFL